jgi:CRISPR-associated protein Csd1
MILQALKEYYDRKAADPKSQIAPPGFSWVAIPYVIVLNEKGKPVSISTTYEGEGKERRAKQYLVPQAVKRAAGIAANLLWDNPEYVLGVVLKGKKRSERKSDREIAKRVSDQHADFIRRIEALGLIKSTALAAVRTFMAEKDKASLLAKHSETWARLIEDGGNTTFQLAGDNRLVLECAEVIAAIKSTRAEESENETTCLVTGEKEPIENLHASIKGVWGAQSSGANIVSFNLDACRSFGKGQGANAPVGRTAAFAYTTALNHLLSRDSNQRIQVGDASVVFWSARETVFEKQIVDFFGEPPKDDPDRNTRAVASLFKSVKSGACPDFEEKTRFYILGLSPNVSRISVRFWVVDTVKGMSEKICRYFEDMRIAHGPAGRDAYSLFRLLVSTATLEKAENIPPNLAGDTMRSILEGLPYPQTLLQAAIRRIRADHEISQPRAALIKACINRAARFKDPQQKEDLNVSLDEDNVNVGYRLGRLFSTLEKIQGEANPGINATIRDRYYGAASSTPVTVFGNLMRLKNHHLAKIENPGRRVNLEKLIGKILEAISNFPAHLTLEDQGRFAIGYYHQMQDFYTKKTE